MLTLAGYSVDFHWGTYTYSIAGESEILLSALLEELGVTELSLATVADVSFTNPALVDVKKIENKDGQTENWLLRSLAPFDTEETLTLTLKNGRRVEIKVTDAGETYTVTWKNEDGTVLETDENVAAGSTPSYDGETPVKAAENGLSYAFTGWSPEIANVTGNVTYTAQFGIALTITADSDSKVYDGTPLTKDSYTVTGLADGHHVDSVTITGDQTIPGSSNNVPSDAKIVDTNGADVTSQYVIRYVNGTLTVNWRTTDVKIQLTGFNGDIATYKITANPQGYMLNDGEPLTLMDTFSDGAGFAAQAINYASVSANSGSGETISYDYRGNTGTYTIPDETPVTITYSTRVQGDAGDSVTFSDRVVLGRTVSGAFEEGPSDTMTEIKTIAPTGTDITGTGGVYMIKLFVYARGHMEQGLEDATFRLLDSNMRPMHYKAGAKSGQQITFTTGDDGYADIQLDRETDGLALQKNTVYFLEMTEAPFQIENGDYIYYQKDDTFYSFLITDDPSYKYGEIYSYFNGDVLKVRCLPQAKGVSITKRFIGNYTLSEAQKNAIRFTLQKESLSSASGWVNVESHTYAEFDHGSINFTAGSENGAPLEDFATYRMIEENALPAELQGVVDENVSVVVSYQQAGEPVQDDSNEFVVDPDDNLAVSYSFTFTNEYVDHKLTIYMIDENTGKLLPGAVYKVYKADGTEVATYTTGENGTVTVRRDDENANYTDGTLYYIVETKAPADHIIPSSPEKVYFYFSGANGAVPDDLPTGATDLTTSYNSLTVANGTEFITVPVTVVWGIRGDEAWPVNVHHVDVGLYMSVNGADPVPVTANGSARTLQLTKDHYYDNTTFTNLPAQEDGKDIVYSVVEEGIYNASGENISTQFADSSTISGTGWHVVKNEPAISVTVEKQWLELDGTTPVGNTSGRAAVSFDLYRTTTATTETSFTHQELLSFLNDAEKVRPGLSLSRDEWSTTVDSLQKQASDGSTYYYYALENPIPDNQEDSYTVAAATETSPRTLTIRNTQTPFTITIQVNNLEKTYGDPDPAYDFTANVKEPGASILVSGPDAHGEYTAVVTDSSGTEHSLKFTVSREENENVGTYPLTLTLSGTAPDGYRVLFDPGTLTIKKRPVTITAGAQKTYGDPDPELIVKIEGLKNGEQPDVLQFVATREAGEDAGDYPITLTGESEQGNYQVTYVGKDEQGNPYTFHINRAQAVVTARNAEKNYGEDDPVFAADVSGLEYTDQPTVISYDWTRDTGENVGSYTIIPTGDKVQGNYEVTYRPATLTIEVTDLTVTATGDAKTYGDPDPEWGISFDGFQLNDDQGMLQSVLNGNTRTYTYTLGEGAGAAELLTFTVSRETGEDIDEYTITPTGDAIQGNYKLTFEPGTLMIDRAELMVTANHAVKALGVTDDPLLTATVTGWKNGDESAVASHTVGTGENAGVITWTYSRGEGASAVELLEFTLKRDPGEAEGEYTITAAGSATQSNYLIDYEMGTFDILSVLDIDVRQPLVDYVDADAAPSYSYTAELDLTGTGLTEYVKNGFEMVNGVPTLTFTLPDADKSDLKTLKVPGNAKLTVTQNADTNAYYTTALALDGTPSDSPADRTCVIRQVDTYHEITYTHSRISLPVEARASTTHEEAGAVKLDGRKAALGIPTQPQSIDGDFAEAMHQKIGFVLANGTYYDHASLYLSDGTPVAGTSGVKRIQYVRERSQWQYSMDDTGDSFTDVPDSAQLVLIYLRKSVSKIGDQKFYTLKEAVEYAVAQNIAAPKIEMLIGDYAIRSAEDTVTIPEGFDVTITTASTGYEGTGKAVISRSLSLTSGHLFDNKGTLTFDNIILDGKNVAARDALVLNEENAVLNVNADAVLRKASGSNGGAIYLKAGTAHLRGTLTNNRAENGGAVYQVGGKLYLSDDAGADSSVLSQNSATNGGAVYLAGGELYLTNETGTISGSLSHNSATSGGAVYLAGGKLEMANETGTGSGSMSNNSATNGGAVYQTGGELYMSNEAKTVNGSMTHNSATENGGALYMTAGTATVSGSMSNNSATEYGGALYMTDGTATVSGSMSNNNATNGGAAYIGNGTLETNGAITDNTSSQSGGAIYGAGGTINVLSGTITGNTATNGNGGAICTESATTSVTGGSVTGNTATNGSGGAIYADSGTVTVSVLEGGTAPSVSGNTATNGNGGAIYSARGSVIHSGGNITNNSAINGAAIYINTGKAELSEKITFNTSSNGGAIGVGSTAAKLYFSGNAEITDNTMNGSASNVYLDVDSESVIHVSTNTLAGKRIGIYVPGDVNSNQVVKHGDVSGYFGAYTDTTGIEASFQSDRYSDLCARCENNRIFWSAKLVYDVVYKKAFDNGPPQEGASYTGTTVSSNKYLKVVTNKEAYPHGAENNRYLMYDFVSSLDLYNLYKSDFDTRAGSATAGAATVYAYTYANSRSGTFDNGLTFADFLTSFRWDNVNRKWQFIKSNGEEANVTGSNPRLVMIHSAPAYLYISNNNTEGRKLTLSLTIGGRDVINEHFGYVTARNGATVESLTPLAASDLTLNAGESVKLLFPGLAGKSYTLTGSFDGSTSCTYMINGGEAQAVSGSDVSITDSLYPQGNYSTEEIVFGAELPICKIGNVTFPRLADAVAYMVAHSSEGTNYTIEMLVDYLIPSTDVLNIPNGYQVTFTTADSFRVGSRTRANLSRDFGNNGSSVMLLGEDDGNSSLTVKNLLFDGRAIAGTGNGGAISTRKCDATVENCEFKGYQATRGGALFFVRAFL